MSINKNKLLEDIRKHSTRKDMLPTYEKIILSSKGFRINKDKAFITLGMNEYEVKDTELKTLLENNISNEYVSLVVEK